LIKETKERKCLAAFYFGMIKGN